MGLIANEVAKVWNAFSHFEKDGDVNRIAAFNTLEIKECMRVFAADSHRAPFKLMQWRLMELSEAPLRKGAKA